MVDTEDGISEAIHRVINKSNEPLETKEVQQKIQELVADVSRSKVMYRLNDLRGKGKIAGKYVGSGKGVWVWWKKKPWRV